MLRVSNRFILDKNNSVQPYPNFGYDVSMKYVCKCKLSQFWKRNNRIKLLSFSLSMMLSILLIIQILDKRNPAQPYPNFG